MAAFRKRGKSIRAEVYRQGERRSATFDTMAKAREWAIVTESAILERQNTGIIPNKTVGDAFERYARDVTQSKRRSLGDYQPQLSQQLPIGVCPAQTANID